MINIVYNCDDNYIDQLMSSIWSVKDNTSSDVHFHIVGNLTNSDRILKYFKYHDIPATIYPVDKELLDNANAPKEYYRLLKPIVTTTLYDIIKRDILDENQHTSPPLFYSVLYNILFDFEQFILLDCDTIVLTDIQKLYNIDLEDYYVGATIDWGAKTFTRGDKIYDHYNPGVLLVNLLKVGPMMYDVFMSTLNNPLHAKFAMQYDWNIIFKDKIKLLDPKWNFPVKKYKDGDDLPYIAHFCAFHRNKKLKNNPLYTYYTKYHEMSKSKSCSYR